jgi:REP element-mobilizing transposase RayT
MDLPKRQKLPHEVPAWVEQGAAFFITVCCERREKNQLCYPVVSSKLFETIRHRHSIEHWWARLFLLMPDHCHALISFSPEIEMRKSISDWKRYTSRKFGIDWQRDFFDHRIRDDENLDEKAYYIRMNPVRKGIVRRSK